MARSNPFHPHGPNLTTFSVVRNGKWRTLNTGSWSQAATLVYPEARPISWVEDKNPAPWVSHYIVNENIHVYEHRSYLTCV